MYKEYREGEFDLKEFNKHIENVEIDYSPEYSLQYYDFGSPEYNDYCRKNFTLKTEKEILRLYKDAIECNINENGIEYYINDKGKKCYIENKRFALAKDNFGGIYEIDSHYNDPENGYINGMKTIYTKTEKGRKSYYIDKKGNKIFTVECMVYSLDPNNRKEIIESENIRVNRYTLSPIKHYQKFVKLKENDSLCIEFRTLNPFNFSKQNVKSVIEMVKNIAENRDSENHKYEKFMEKVDYIQKEIKKYDNIKPYIIQ
jgi:hypothetical protein